MKFYIFVMYFGLLFGCGASKQATTVSKVPEAQSQSQKNLQRDTVVPTETQVKAVYLLLEDTDYSQEQFNTYLAQKMPAIINTAKSGTLRPINKNNLNLAANYIPRLAGVWSGGQWKPKANTKISSDDYDFRPAATGRSSNSLDTILEEPIAEVTLKENPRAPQVPESQEFPVMITHSAEDLPDNLLEVPFDFGSGGFPQMKVFILED